MSMNENPVESLPDDLDAFDNLFHGRESEPKSEPETEANPSEEEAVETEDSDALEPTEDTQDDDDTVETEDDHETEDEEEEDEGEPEPESKPKKKNRFQERINEFTRELRETQRQLEAVIAENAKLKQTNEPTPAVEAVEPDTGPTPEDKDEDGTEKYPLGEFDPKYIRDLTRHTMEQERLAFKAQDEQEAQMRVVRDQQAALQAEWETKLGPAQERYPDFREKGEQLVGTFEKIDQSYGEYLATTIKSMEFGPDVLYYLSNNLDEAEAIVASGATKATIALGRLEAKFAEASMEKQRAKPRVSKAPAPPPTNKGSASAVGEVPDDTDDLDAFSAKLFKKSKR